MRANTISVKPLSEIHFYTAILAFSVFFFLDIAAILTLDKLAIILAIASNLFVVICYMLVRLFYNVRYTVNHECLLKTKGTEVLFGIDVRDIVAVYIKPRSKIDFLSYLWDVIINSGFPQEPHGTTFSIIFKKDCLSFRGTNVDILSGPLRDIPVLYLKPRELDDCFEQNEILSFRKCMKICKVMGIEPQIISRKKRK